ncbi:MAG TPA: 50S ribosomal protein L24 [Candidatus Limnocylindrales bacterium]|nr:50S ribosomal protein L24 [Candidatus Limnocylindrales bacterium]
MPRTAEAPQMKVPEIRKGDQVLVLTGKDAGKRGVVDRVVRPDKVVVEGINIAKKHTKPRARQGRNDRSPRVQQGGIIDIARPLSVSNVMVVCPSCSQPTRVGHNQPSEGKGRSIRICRRCGEALTREGRS